MQLDESSQSPAPDGAASESKRNASWRAELNDNYCKLRKLELPPVGYGPDGKLKFAEKAVANPESYILWDVSRDAPPGFGLKVAGKKTYILRRKVMGKSMLAKVGNFTDFERIQDARAKAAKLALAMVATGQNPNAAAREQNAAEVTLRQAMLAYREHMVERTQRPAKPETLKVYDRVMRRHEEWEWSDRKVREIPIEDIKKKFLETNKITPTATEQAFRWPARAINWYIENEKIKAQAQSREPHIKGNPFNILAINNFYRSQEQIDEAREEQGKRNPLRPTQDLGRFLEACWSKKNTNDNMTGIHYLMLMLLWGCRKNEHAGLVWGELLSELGGPGIGRRSTSHVYMKDHPDWGPYVYFYKTKNGRSHRMPITPMTLELLKRRQVAAAEAVLWGVLMDMEDALIRLNTLPDSATLTNSEAALFVRLSITTFDRMRAAGTGPRYMQGGSYGAKGTNQACTYHVKDLKDWQAGNKVSSPLEAAIRKGQTFSTIFELGQQEAFYVDPFGRVEGMCERTQVATVVERIGQWDIAWMTPVEAASREWSSMSAHQPFAAEIQEVLAKAASSVAQGVAATDLGDGIAPGASKPNRRATF